MYSLSGCLEWKSYQNELANKRNSFFANTAAKTTAVTATGVAGGAARVRGWYYDLPRAERAAWKFFLHSSTPSNDGRSKWTMALGCR